ncbi:MAG: hypothetical protein OXC05_02385 [Halieaceae bacterium]|nr:hypothetical protein [Halieaceae bacterium]
MNPCLPLALLLCLTPVPTHAAVVPADPFRLPVRALDLMPHSTVGDSLNALLAQIGFRLNLESPRLGRRIAAQPLPQWVVRDEILTLRELIGEVVGPEVVLLIDPARRTVSLDIPGSVLGETATDTTLQGCLQAVALSGLLDKNGFVRPQTAASAAWRVVGNSAKPHALSTTPLSAPTPAVAFEVVPIGLPGPAAENSAAMFPAEDLKYLAPAGRPAPIVENQAPIIPARGVRNLAPDSRPAPAPEAHASMVPSGGMRYLAPTVRPAPILENRAAIIAAEELKYVVAEGDTVSELARRFRPPGWSFRNTFDHIVENSPAALAEANPNHLRVGEVVSIPAPGEAGAVQPLSHPSPQAVLEPLEKPPAATYTLRLETGSLRTNLVRILADHGYTLGQWGFGSAEEEIDWRIPKGYSYTQPNDLAAVLRALGRTYRLRAVINELDQTVDFSPARAGGGL